MTPPRLTNRLGLPLAMQMIVILVCALIGAQLVTLGLTVILPPSPTARWNIDEVASALTTGDLSDRLERKPMVGPPDVSGQGWLVSESSRDALAQRLGRHRKDVVLAFYTQLPVGGVAVPSNARSPLAMVESKSAAISPGARVSALLVGSADAQSIPGGPPPGGAPGPSGMPGGHFPGGMPPGGSMPHVPSMPRPAMPGGGARPGGHVPGGAMPGGKVPGGKVPGAAPGGQRPGGGQPGAPSGGQNPGNAAPGAGTGGPTAAPGNPSGGVANQDGHPGQFVSPGARPGGMAGPMAGPMGNGAIGGGLPAPVMPSMNDIPRATLPIATPDPIASPTLASRPVAVSIPLPPVTLASPSASASALPTPLATSAAETATPLPAVPGAPQPIPFRHAEGSFFALTSPPFIEGDFVAATRQPDGQWLAVAPRAEPFPNAWQKRVMLWFALSLAIISPLAWLFARRIVVPLKDFAQAAEQLGRDPSATILPLSGPAEIGRAANAFNQMRYRLRAFVDDRTAMVGAISHDLRTPLTRLRFRIEDVPDDQREGLLKEVTEMEAMISQVIAFIRDASTPGPRKRVDFADLIAGSVADAQLVGGKVTIEHNLHIPVEVDPVGIRRLLGNLLENAIKYGDSAKVRVSLLDGEAVAEIVDAGPGIPEDEFDRAFEPFYRSETARKSGQNGTGLGLAVCRSIARAHGGDVHFVHGGDGFAARVTVPAAAFDPTLRKAA
ncbi:signal transduction histidine kinase [Novosphingobium sp. PhB57]|uniref:ATP-binding protein n=1 Tax=Novosphingobium sp. PhB57 TaxID=2485107 RepID=UPI001049D012|nr:ATP-binding protein [Novosphingobium sp. PhB57]TCU55986.1 signal transduction histidine kinase [Novosphingobium sp. PhB57]